MYMVYLIQTGVGLGEEGGEAVLVATPPQVLGHNAVGHLESQGESGRGSRGRGFPSSVCTASQFLHQPTAQLRLQ